jgi:hypothetical protein
MQSTSPEPPLSCIILTEIVHNPRNNYAKPKRFPVTTIASRLQIGDAAPAITVLDIHGQPTPLAPYWAGGLTLLTFLRHFG